MTRTTRADDATSEVAFPDAQYPLKRVTHESIGACFEVHRALGYGFLESVYRRALEVELEYRGIPVAREVTYALRHRGVDIGVYRADLVVARAVIVEVKTGLLLDPVAQPQLLNYLRASSLQVGLVLHFGPRPSIKRVVHSLGEAAGRA